MAETDDKSLIMECEDVGGKTVPYFCASVRSETCSMQESTIKQEPDSPAVKRIKVEPLDDDSNHGNQAQVSSCEVMGSNITLEIKEEPSDIAQKEIQVEPLDDDSNHGNQAQVSNCEVMGSNITMDIKEEPSDTAKKEIQINEQSPVVSSTCSTEQINPELEEPTNTVAEKRPPKKKKKLVGPRRRKIFRPFTDDEQMSSGTGDHVLEQTRISTSPPNYDSQVWIPDHDYNIPDHDYGVPEKAPVQYKLKRAKEYIKYLEAVHAKLIASRFGIARFSNDPDMIRFYTGFPSYKRFNQTFLDLQPTADKLEHWSKVQKQRRDSSETLTECMFRDQGLSLIDQFFLLMCFFRQGFPEIHLSDCFDISETSVTHIIITWVKYLYFVLGMSPVWPSKEDVDQTMPKCIRETYPTTRVVLDSIDVKCQTASSFDIESQMYWNCRGPTQFKGLLGLTPAGQLSFVSMLHPGQITDKELIKRSGIYGLLEQGDGVIVDTSFTIEKGLEAVGAHIIIPPFHTGVHNRRAKKEEIDKIAHLQALHAHVSCCLSWVRECRVFERILQSSLFANVHQMFAVCCLLTNFMGPVCGDD